MVKDMKSFEDWKLVDPELCPPEYCPDAATKYKVLGSKTPVNRLPKSLFDNLRKHLAFLGWRIECLSSDDSLRFRYTSPDGDLLHSLNEACQKLKQEAPKKMNSDTVTVRDGPKTFLARQDNNSDGDSFVDEPQFCPEAVVYWYRNGQDRKNRKSEMGLKAKKHLLAMKWSLWYKEKAAGKQELRYTSPKGKVYYSLRMACKGCIDEGGVPQTILSGENLSSSCNEKSPVPAQTEGPITEFSAKKSRRLEKKSDLAPNTPQTGVAVDSDCIKDGGETQDDKNVSPRSGKDVGKLMNSRDDQNPVQPLSPFLSLLIENKVVSAMEEVHYRGNKRDLAYGCITPDGIKCHCCSNVFGLSAFEAHAGSKNHRPAANIRLSNGRSLKDCHKEALCNDKTSRKSHESRKRKRNELESYDLCSICYLGGELMLCDHCPATFHKECLGLDEIPDGDWFCPPCCCGICGEGKFEHTPEHSVNDNTGRVCDQCEHKFHIGCIRRRYGMVKLKNFSQNKWFCSDRCENVFSGLHELIGKPFSVGGGNNNLTWRVLKCLKSDPNASKDSEVRKGIQKKLKEAFHVMHESFETMKDPLTRRDLVEDVIYNRGSELKHLNFGGFYTAVLEKKGVVVSVVTVRIFEDIAEIPLVATKYGNRKRGMCRLMMNELEKKLTALGVERLILPSAAKIQDTWTTKFGYSKVTDSERLKLLNYTFLGFARTILCQKLLTRELPAESFNPGDVNMEFNWSSAVPQALAGETDRVVNRGLIISS